eukprot:scaffold51686_cov34-Attheya_sp.AAC.2
MVMVSLFFWFLAASAGLSLLACGGGGCGASMSSVFNNTDDLAWEERTGYSNLGLGRHHPIMFANETHGFLMTGTTPASLGTSDMFVYEASTDQWTELVDINSGPGARSFGYGVVLPVAHHPKAYVGFGVPAANSGERLSDFWEFDMMTHTWTPLANFPGLGRRHPAMNAVFSSSWQIQVGLGDGITTEGQFANFNDWWSYDIALNTWTRLDDFPSTPRHHPFHFALQQISYVGLGHSAPRIERDFYGYHNTNTNTDTDTEQPAWQRESDFASYDTNTDVIVTTEARVAGTQFSIELPLPTMAVGNDSTEKDANSSSSVLLSGALGFVLSGDGDDHGTMVTGEFHVFDPKPSSETATGRWRSLPPHPGRSRWAPGSF